MTFGSYVTRASMSLFQYFHVVELFRIIFMRPGSNEEGNVEECIFNVEEFFAQSVTRMKGRTVSLERKQTYTYVVRD